MAYPEPTQVAPWYLRNINQALELDEATGNVFVRTNAALIGNVSVGNVSIGAIGNIDLTGNTLPVTINSGNVTVYQGTDPWNITGSANVSGNVGILGNVSVTQSANSTPWSVSGNVTATVDGGNITITGNPAQITAFAEPLAIPITPKIQADAVYGLDPDIWTQGVLNGGNISVSNSVWSVSCTTSANSFARLRTSRFMSYRPGQGAMARWTAAFTVGGGSGLTSQGITNAPQLTGFLNREDGYAFGFSGDATDNKFGILHRYGGKIEIRTLTISQYNTGAQTATITLNGVAYTVSLTASTSNAYCAAQIAAKLNSQAAVTNLWSVDACGDTLTFSYYIAAPVDGTFGFSSTGTGTLAAGTFARTQTGVYPTEDWTYIADWDTKPSNFDPSNLNVYAIDFRWLGAGIVRFFMENPSTGELILVYTQKWTSENLTTHINNPSLRLTYRAGPTDGSTPADTVTVRGASVFAGLQGIVSQTHLSQGYSYINTTQQAKDTVWHLMSVQNPYVRGTQNNSSQLVVQSLSVSSQSNDPSIIYLVINARGTSDYLVYAPIPGADPNFVFAQVSNSAVSENISLDIQNNIQSLGINGGATFDLIPYNFSLAPGDALSVFISSGSAINRTSCGLTWKVD